MMSTAVIKTLIVDDDDVDREKTVRFLKKMPLEFDIHEADSAQSAQIILNTLAFDCVILDYRLKDSDGMALIKPIQQHKKDPTPIIMVSGLGDETVAASAIRDGAFDYLPKRALIWEHLKTSIDNGLIWAENERRLQEERKRFVELSNGLPQLVWTCTPKGRCDFVNKRWSEYTGLAFEQHLGMQWLDHIHPDDKQAVLDAWDYSLETLKPFNARYHIKRYDNSYRLFESHSIPYFDNQGNVSRWLGSSTDITDAENAHLVQAYLAAIIESSTDAIISKDIHGNITSWNHSAELLFGYSIQEAIGNHIAELIIPAEVLHEETLLIERLKAGEQVKAFETIRCNKEGRRFPVSLTFSHILSRDGKLMGFAKIVRDISDKLAIETALLRSEERFRTAFNAAPVGMALVNLEGQFIEANNAMLKLVNCDINQLRKFTQEQLTFSDDIRLEKAEIKYLLKNHAPISFEKRILSANGKEIPVMASVALLFKDGVPESFLYQYIDLSERKQYETRLIELAHFDPLTGLANRTKFNSNIENLLLQSKRNSTPFAVLFGDLDHFKDINDSLGHEAGDQLLKCIAERLKGTLRQSDFITRLGGDEFVILLSPVTNFETVVNVAHKLMRSVEAPITINSSELHMGMSFGIALYPTDGDDAATLLRNADSALYDAKAKGRGCFSLYREELTQLVENRLKLDADLRKALELGQFQLHFQPVISLNNNNIISAEALVRWYHPEKGLIPPNDFIPYAQETGLIVPLGEWIIHEACRVAKSWEDAGYSLAVAVNISARQFKDDSLLRIIDTALHAHNLDKEKLHLEITEQLLLEDTEHNLQQIESLKNYGLKIYLDDFGIGYSSLSYIIRFSPHFLKIDYSFTSKIGSASQHDAMVEAIISLQNILPMEIIAEGVETEEQRNFLKQHGCEFAQGYLFSKPIPEKDFLKLLEKAQQIYFDMNHRLN